MKMLFFSIYIFVALKRQRSLLAMSNQPVWNNAQQFLDEFYYKRNCHRKPHYFFPNYRKNTRNVL